MKLLLDERRDTPGTRGFRPCRETRPGGSLGGDPRRALFQMQFLCRHHGAATSIENERQSPVPSPFGVPTVDEGYTVTKAVVARGAM